MCLKECFCGFGRKRAHEAVVRMRQVEDHEVRPLLHPGDHHLGLAEVRLCLTWRVGQRDEHLLATDLRRAHVVLHDRVTARVSMLGPQPFENPLGCVPLLARALLVVFENRVDRILPRAQLRPPHRLVPLVARRRRILKHLANRLARKPKLPRRRPPAHPLHQNRPPHPCV